MPHIEKLKKLLAVLDPSLPKEEIVRALEGALFLNIKILEEAQESIKLIGLKVDEVKKGKGEQGDKGDKPVAGIDFPFPKDGKDGKDGKSIKGNKGESIKGDKGDSPSEEKLIELINPLIPKPLKGDNGSPDSPTEVRNKLESLTGEDRLDIDSISGLKKLIKEIPERPVKTFFGPGKTKIFTIDLSSQLNGSLKTFFIGTHFGIISVNSSSAPFGAFLPDTDYKETGKDIVFTSAVNAAVSLATGQSLVVRFLK